MRNRWMRLVTTVTLGLLALPATAGGFGFTLKEVTGTHDKAPKAIVFIEQAGCVSMDDIKFTATLERMVDGKRQTINLKTVAVEKEKLAIEQTWKPEAGWSLVVRAQSGSMTCSALAHLDAAGKPIIVRDKETDKTKIALTYFGMNQKISNEQLEKLLAARPSVVNTKSN